MAQIEFPQALKNLLEDSPLQPHIRDYANRAGEILDDKQMPFFPSYTDHSGEHIHQVLQAEADLIPAEVWERCKTKEPQQRLLRPEDAAVLIGGTLLHDIAMHLHPDGFLELVGANSRFQPLPWFKDEQQGHQADRPWRELWLDYQREARRFSDGKLGGIIGMDEVRQGWKFETLPPSPGLWQENHRLVIGEFIRRHHARLAHEIAYYGFPGLETGHGTQQFPALAEPGHPLENLADLIGLTARSHGMNLRTCQAYLDLRYGKRGPRHRGCAVLYPMALLRVADYLQIDRRRTPAILLKLRNPQSPVSVQEWQKHLALLNIDEAHDPSGKSIEVSGQISHAVYLQLRELVDGLQKEMDHATAVLAEAYGRHEGLSQLSLATRRVHSNLSEPAFRASLPYVPERTGYATDPNLLTLLVEPLYGKEPGVGVRELMQNSVDAVRELHAWCESHGKRVEDLDLPEQEADVQIDFIDEKGDGNWILRVTDKGIGMTADTIQNYFLRAGASFRQSPEWTKEFVDDDGKPTVLRAGRFGIGAFAIFLLGPRFRLCTRHVTADKSQGYYLEAEGDSRGIEIQKVEKLDIGTTIEVSISDDSIARLGFIEYDNILKCNLSAIAAEKGLDEKTYRMIMKNSNPVDWFCWDWPQISKQIIKGSSIEKLHQTYFASLQKHQLPPEWSAIYQKDFSVYWTFSDFPPLTCNGIIINHVQYLHQYVVSVGGDDSFFKWPKHIQLECPKIAVLDKSALLPLTVQRYALSDKNLSFLNELGRDVTLSFIGHALVCAPASRLEAHVPKKHQKPHPLVFHEEGGKEVFTESRLRWCSSSTALIPADPWLYSLLQANACIVAGIFRSMNHPSQVEQKLFYPIKESEQNAVLIWNHHYSKSEHIKLIECFSGMIKSNFGLLDGNALHVEALVSWGTRLRASSIISMDLKTPVHQQYNWHNFNPKNTLRTYLIFKAGSTNEPANLQALLEAMELYGVDDFLFVANLRTTRPTPQPETLLAKLWNECLGPNPIPFDPVARQALIERGRQHLELKRHIEAWEEMKRTGSKWVVGED